MFEAEIKQQADDITPIPMTDEESDYNVSQELHLIGQDVWKTAAFDNISDPSFKNRKKRFGVAGKLLSYQPDISKEDLDALDVAIMEGKNYKPLLRPLINEASKNTGILKSWWNSAKGAAKGMATKALVMSGGQPDEDSAMEDNMLQHGLKEAGDELDPILLAGMSELKHSALLPQSAAELQRHALSWVLTKIKETTNTIAHKETHRIIKKRIAEYRDSAQEVHHTQVEDKYRELKESVNAIAMSDARRYVLKTTTMYITDCPYVIVRGR